MPGVGLAVAGLEDLQGLGGGQGAEVGAARAGAVHRDTTADGHVDGDELGRHEARYIDHVQAIGLGEVGGFPGDLGQLGEEGVGHVHQGVGGQVVVADLHHPRGQLEALGLRVLTHVAQLFQGVDHALRRAFVDVGGRGDFRQVHGPLRGVEGPQHRQALLQ